MDPHFVQVKLVLLLVSTSKIDNTTVNCIIIINAELEFSATMTCDDICNWLKQNDMSEKDILPFRSKSRSTIFFNT